MNSWLKHWDFVQDPFSKEVSAQDLWLPTSKEGLVTQLVDACETRSSAVLVGEAGVGKTCMLRAMQTRLPEARFCLTYYCNATLGRRDFYRTLCTAMGLQARGSAAAVFAQVHASIEGLGQSHVHPVLILDESHMLHQDVLDHLHILLNFAWDQKALLSVILVGLPDLSDKLALQRNRSLYSRLALRAHIGSHTLEDTTEYVAHRMRVGGRAAGPAFEPEALALLHESSHGTLRAIDRIARLALQKASIKGQDSVSAAAMKKAIAVDPRGS